MRSLLIAVFALASVAWPASAQDTLAGIKSDCSQDWPNNYRMQEYCIDTQVESYNNLVNVKNRGLSSDLQSIFAQCLADWKSANGRNWRMVEYCFENQVESYDRLRASSGSSASSSEVQAAPEATQPADKLTDFNKGDPGPIEGKAQIVDGDTLFVAGKRVRLDGIDAPDLDQDCIDASSFRYACGQKAASALKDVLSSSAELRCEFKRWDRYDRYVGDCLYSGKSVAAWLVEQGHAVNWPKKINGPFAAEQERAKAEKRGLWAGQFDEPWQWRLSNGNRSEESADAMVFGSFSSTDTVP